MSLIDVETTHRSSRDVASSPQPLGIPGSWTLVVNDDFNTLSESAYLSYYGVSATVNAGLASTFTADLSTNANYGVQSDQEGGITSASSTIKSGALSVGAFNTSCTIGGVSKPKTRGLVRTKAAYLYGAFEARIKLPAGQGLWPAFWMWPVDPDDRSDFPEIDILE